MLLLIICIVYKMIKKERKISLIKINDLCRNRLRTTKNDCMIKS